MVARLLQLGRGAIYDVKAGRYLEQFEFEVATDAYGGHRSYKTLEGKEFMMVIDYIF